MTACLEGLIDGQKVRVPRETTILEAARSIGRSIPTLCHHEGLPADGNCRLCLVEVDGRLAASCMYPLRRNGFEIFTGNEKIREARRFVLELLINRSPRSPRLLALALEYGVEPDPRFMAEDGGELCIRCGRCVRACEINGTAAISLVGRGWKRQVAGPFFQPPEDCVGCRACAEVCPTGAITYTERDSRRSIWSRNFELIKCEDCGKPFATDGEIKKAGLEAVVCPDCRRKDFAASISKIERIL